MGLTDLETIPETGAVFTIGRSRFADNVASHFFIRRDPVLSITCGDEHSAVICQTGRLFVFGSNDWGQLGLGHKNHISKPSCVKALKPERVTHVACGRAHTLICTGSQKIFACGSDQEGQLGRGISAIGDSANTPVLVYDSGLSGPKIVQIAAGSHHSLALTSDGGVFAWGSNLEGQLGLSDVSGLVNKPTKVHVPEPVKQISAGYYHSTFLTESGLVYVCGESESGKLGIDASFSTQVAPKQMQLPSPAVHVACGGHHTVVLAENGNLYCTGSNSSGQLGLGSNLSELHIPKLLPRGMLRNETITRISCGESHTAVVTESGKLYTCGDGRHGKLGLEENENNVHELTFVQRYKELFVSNVACGGCHTILVGQRRDTNNHSQKEDNSQMEHIQKRNSLPPLKLPVNRLQSETHDENVNEIMKDRLNQGNNITESITNAQEAIETSMETIEENIKNKVDDVTNNVIDFVNNIEKSDSPRNSPEKSTNGKPEEISSNAMSNEENAEVTSKEMAADIGESEESKLEENENSVPKREEEESTTKTNDKSENVEKEKRSESMDKEENNEENNNETTTEATINNTGNEEEEINVENGNTENKDETDGKRKNSQDVKTEPMESNNGDDTKLETSPEKQTSPSDSTPPPKPPRLKSSSENSSTDNEKTSSMEKENEIKTEDTSEKKPETIEENESGKKKGSGSMKSTRSSGSIKSTRSRANMEEAIEIDKQTDKAKIIEEEKMNNDNVQDDADVQSPPPRTGKMSKIFKSKKPQTTENGTKTTGIANQKSKSKTCIIL
ncbi:uncharacterized protein isoform X2 [Bombus fervidus]|uniref:uncharacterized protein isoform X2 n=1 Tax=Bombus fervidus TaxID=203811 RepID=UPI003AB31114